MKLFLSIHADPRHEGGSSHDGEDDDELPSIPVEETMRQLTIQPTHTITAIDCSFK